MTREEAIETIRRCCPKISDSECDFETAMRFLIPELAESEDERIRKALIDALKTSKSVGELKFVLPEPTRKDCIAYLEKQKEQKPVEFGLWKDTKKELPKPDSLILVQDFDVIRSLYYEGDGYLDKADGIKLSIYQKWCYQSDVKKIKPAEWSEEHIADIFEKVGLAKIVREQGNDALTNAVQSAMIELSKVENTQWSEEDERILKGIIGKIDHDQTYGVSKVEMLSFLEDLRPSLKPSEVCYGPKGDPDPAGVWKPSEEQMKALHRCIYYLHGEGSGYFEPIKSLYEQLKKL